MAAVTGPGYLFFTSFMAPLLAPFVLMAGVRLLLEFIRRGSL